jgi:hypothetical protein
MRGFTNGRAPVYHAMRFQSNAVAQLNFVTDNRVGTDVAVVSDARPWADDCGRMNETFFFDLCLHVSYIPIALF